MSTDGQGDTTYHMSRPAPEGAFLGALRASALIAVLIGAAGSFGFMLYNGRNAPRLLIVLFTIWVLSPFVILVLAHALSKTWSAPTRATLYLVMWGIALGSLAVYADDARGHRRPQAAFVYVAVPPVSWLLTAIAVPTAALISRLQATLSKTLSSPNGSRRDRRMGRL